MSEKTSEGAERDHGGPAFPGQPVARYFPGMTLRDWFAGQVLAGLAANAALARDPTSGAEFRARIAETVYAVADSVLAERRK